MVAGTPAPDPQANDCITFTVSVYPDRTIAKINGTITDMKIMQKIIKLSEIVATLDEPVYKTNFSGKYAGGAGCIPYSIGNGGAGSAG